jgi:AraC family transcriptional regulator
MNFRIVDKPAFIALGRTKQFTTANGANYKLIPLWWSEFLSSSDYAELIALSRQQPGKVTGGNLLGIDFGSPETVEFSYGIGVELPESISSEVFSKMDIAPATWAIFDCAMDQMRETYKYIFNEWFPTSGYEHDAVPHIEVYLPETPGEKMKCELWIPVVKKKPVL